MERAPPTLKKLCAVPSMVWQFSLQQITRFAGMERAPKICADVFRKKERGFNKLDGTIVFVLEKMLFRGDGASTKIVKHYAPLPSTVWQFSLQKKCVSRAWSEHPIYVRTFFAGIASYGIALHRIALHCVALNRIESNPIESSSIESNGIEWNRMESNRGACAMATSTLSH